MSPFYVILVGQLLWHGATTRRDFGRQEKAVPTSEQIVEWGSDEYPLYGEPDGKLGMEVEISLPTGSWKDWGKMAVLGQNVDKIMSAVSKQIAEQGISATVQANECKCFLPGRDGSHTLPFLITVEGIADYKKFGEAQLATVTNGLYEQLAVGTPVPPGASFSAATDASGKKVRNLKEELEDNPELHRAVESVSLQKLHGSGMYHGLDFSPQQVLLEVELNKYELISTKVGKSSMLAYLAGKAGAGKSQDIARTVYSLLAKQLVQQVRANGINILISSPEYASQYLSSMGMLAEGAAKALHARNNSIQLDEGGIVDLDKAYPQGLPGGVIPPHATQWKRTVGKNNKVLGFRLVMTVTSVNELFSLQKLPLLRTGIAATLRKALPENLKSIKFRGNRLFDPAVIVKGCGWKPALASQPPFPHDEAGCREATSYREVPSDREATSYEPWLLALEEY